MISFAKLKTVTEEMEHTMIEADDVRYLYQPVGDVLVVLVTNLRSNIIYDLKTLKLLAEVLEHHTKVKDISIFAFKILEAFDEVISPLGYSESTDIKTIQLNLAMNSEFEKLELRREYERELEAKETAKRKAKEIERKRRSSNGLHTDIHGLEFSENRFQSSSPVPSAPNNYYETYTSELTSTFKGRGLTLEKSKKGRLQNLRSGLNKNDDNVRLLDNPEAHYDRQSQNNFNLQIFVNEEFNAALFQDGSMKHSVLEGSLQAKLDDKILKIAIPASDVLHIRTHPNLDKNLFKRDRILKLQTPKNRQLELLRWNMKNIKSPVAIKIALTPELLTGRYLCRVDYGSEKYQITDLKIKIPLMTGDVQVISTDVQCNMYDDGIECIIYKVNPGTNGVFEFAAEGSSENDFFPIHAEFSIKTQGMCLSNIEIIKLCSSSGQKVLPLDIITHIESGNFSLSK